MHLCHERKALVALPLFENTCRWIFTGCPQQTNSPQKGEICQCRKDVWKEILTTHIFIGGWKNNLFCLLFSQYFSCFVHWSWNYKQLNKTPSLSRNIIYLWRRMFTNVRPRLRISTTWCPSVSGREHPRCVLYIVEVMISWTVDPVTVSSDSYPAAPDFVQPDSDNLRQGLLQQHLRTQKIISAFIRT